MVENSFEGYISFFILYIPLINYSTYMDQNLIFGPNWVKKNIVPIRFSLSSLFRKLY